MNVFWHLCKMCRNSIFVREMLKQHFVQLSPWSMKNKQRKAKILLFYFWLSIQHLGWSCSNAAQDPPGSCNFFYQLLCLVQLLCWQDVLNHSLGFAYSLIIISFKFDNGLIFRHLEQDDVSCFFLDCRFVGFYQ